jgi:hypothetical protein
MEKGGEFHSAAVLTTGKWMFSRAGVDVLEKKKNLVSLLRIEFRFLGGPVHRTVSISTGLSRLNTKSEVGGGKTVESRGYIHSSIHEIISLLTKRN